jgi:hypothetical protein
MTTPFTWLGLGAGAMFFLDPRQGRRRRALVRDQLTHACSRSAKAADVVRRDATNRFVGTLAEARGALRRDHAADDVLVDRVRARIGRVVSHPAAIEVRAHMAASRCMVRYSPTNRMRSWELFGACGASGASSTNFICIPSRATFRRFRAERRERGCGMICRGTTGRPRRVRLSERRAPPS